MKSKLLSLALHAVAFFAGLWLPQRIMRPAIETKPPVLGNPIKLHLQPTKPSTEPGGGGNESPIPPSRGGMRFARNTFIPKFQRAVNLDPELVLEPSMPVKLESNFEFANIGVPGAPPGPPSLGTGRNGIGANGDGGVGVHGGGGIERSASGPIVDPELIKRTEPEYSDEARKARVSGLVVLKAVVGLDGKPADIRVVQGLGLGLDEKAIEAVARWRFRPAHQGNRPVAVSATIYVNFRLL